MQIAAFFLINKKKLFSEIYLWHSGHPRKFQDTTRRLFSLSKPWTESSNKIESSSSCYYGIRGDFYFIYLICTRACIPELNLLASLLKAPLRSPMEYSYWVHMRDVKNEILNDKRRVRHWRKKRREGLLNCTFASPVFRRIRSPIPLKDAKLPDNQWNSAYS